MGKKKINISTGKKRPTKHNSSESGEGGERAISKGRSKGSYVIPDFMNQCRRKESSTDCDGSNQKWCYKKSADELFSDKHELLFPWEKKFVADRFRLIEKEDVKDFATKMKTKLRKEFSKITTKMRKEYSKLRTKAIQLLHGTLHGQKKEVKLSCRNAGCFMQTRLYKGGRKNVKRYGLRKNA